VFIAPTDTRHPVANMTALYYVLGLPAASRYLEMDPGIETEPAVQRQIIAELRRCPWVILWRSAAWNEPNASRTAGSALLQRDLRARYVTVLRTPLYLLLRSRVS
jgi:hypothetical protein